MRRAPSAPARSRSGEPARRTPSTTLRLLLMQTPAPRVASVSLQQIEAARDRIRGTAVVTPMEESRWLSAIAGTPVSLKCENLQRTGSFKIRGAYLRISNLSPEERATGVVAASAGNHAQGVALAAQMLGIHATV